MYLFRFIFQLPRTPVLWDFNIQLSKRPHAVIDSRSIGRLKYKMCLYSFDKKRHVN
jgi:hypothetical protein